MMHVVALSGGKDSTALALRLAAVEPRDYTYVCTPTGNELPEMFEHWRKLGELLGKPILPIMHSTGLFGVVRRQNMLPNYRARFCTRILKIEPYRIWLAQNTPCVSYVGLRADEEGRAGGAYGDIDGVEMRFPLREWRWGKAEVVGYLESRGVTIPRRTDCAVCYHQQIGEWWDLWHDHIEEWMEGEALEFEIGGTLRSPGRDTWPVSMRDLRAAFEAGRTPKAILKRQEDPSRQSGGCRVCTL
jgi:3'-phosphoadenosine 5'-phosphosulfate sulfotransferase (PAPS reductase)/FAD synthetase